MKTLLLAVWVTSLPAAAFAQAAITGTVRDSTGAVLPGVSVEASSPVLIEKTREVLTDRIGRYRIGDLRPGIYKVRFTRPGWSPFEQDGIELTGSFTATVNAELLTLTKGTPMGGATQVYEVPDELLALARRNRLAKTSSKPLAGAAASGAGEPAPAPLSSAAPAPSRSFNWLAVSLITYALICITYWLVLR